MTYEKIEVTSSEEKVEICITYSEGNEDMVRISEVNCVFALASALRVLADAAIKRVAK